MSRVPAYAKKPKFIYANLLMSPHDISRNVQIHTFGGQIENVRTLIGPPAIHPHVKISNSQDKLTRPAAQNVEEDPGLAWYRFPRTRCISRLLDVQLRTLNPDIDQPCTSTGPTAIHMKQTFKYYPRVQQSNVEEDPASTTRRSVRHAPPHLRLMSMFLFVQLFSYPPPPAYQNPLSIYAD